MRDYKIIYTSSYDRGLQHLLDMWPDIKKEVPEATLDIYYGWKLFVQFYKGNPASMAWKDKMDKLMTQDGVKDHDRISQEELRKVYEDSAILAYPTHFGEINCISAIKAQAYGAIPIVINYAALRETVQFGIKIEGDIYDKEIKDNYKKWLIWALKNKEWQDEVREPMMKWAQRFKWENIADQWIEMFEGKETKSFMEEPEERKLIIVKETGGEQWINVHSADQKK